MKSAWRILLAPLSALWYAAAILRGKLFDWHLLPSRSYGIPVICVGNLAVGGTGKTPHVEYLLKLLHEKGCSVAMLSRGYGRRTKGFLLANREQKAADIGDEPYQTLRNCPFATVAVCERRTEGMSRLLALPEPPGVVVLDDAYQHRYVRAGLNILLTDAHRVYTQDHLLPWGRLREPASAARRADVVIATKCEAKDRPVLPLEPRQRYFLSHIVYGGLFPFEESHEKLGEKGGTDSGMHLAKGRMTEGRPLLLITGIASPASIRAHFEEEGCGEIRMVSFPDHHAFTAGDATIINKEWRACGNGAVAVTTQKDTARLESIFPMLDESLRVHLLVQPITVVIEDTERNQESFNQIILNYVSQNSRNRRMD